MKTSLRLGFTPVVSVVLFFVLVLGLFAGLLVLRNEVKLSSQASETQEIPVSASVADRKVGLVHKSKVLFITLNPTDNGKNIANEYFSWHWGGKSLKDIEAKVPRINVSYYNKLSDGRINFEVVKTLKIKTSPKYTNGYTYTVADYSHCVNGGLLSNGLSCEDQKYLFDHNAFLTDNNICSIVNTEHIDEVWLLSSPFITTWEAWMVGPTEGYGPNGGTYVDSRCQKHFVVMSLVYDQISPMGHTFGHRIESTMNYLSVNWIAEERKSYIEDFMNLDRYATTYGVQGNSYPGPGCGNAHFPLNGLSHYDYGENIKRDFNCRDWNNFPDFKGRTASFGCKEWGCGDFQWNAYWQAAMPHSGGKASIDLIDGRKIDLKRDWWFYILYPDNAIAFYQSSQPLTKTIQEPGKLFKTVVEHTH